MKVLVARTDHMGDLILSTPVAKALKDDISGCRVSFLVNPSLKELLDGNPYIDEVFVDDRDGRHSGIKGFFSLASETRAKGFDASVVLFAEPRAAFLPFFSRIPVRIGPLSRLYSVLCFNRPIKQSRSLSVKNEAEYNLDLLRALGCKPTAQKAHISLNSGAVARVKEKLDKIGISSYKRKIVVHPGSRGSGKNWKEDRYARLADLLIEEFGSAVFFTGSASEAGLIERIIQGMSKKAFSLCGQMSLSELAACMSLVDLFIGPSTGPLHLASAVGTSVIGLYSPVRVQGPTRWAPFGKGRKEIIVPQVECPERYSCDPSCPLFDCFDLIKPEDVIGAARKLL